MRTFKVRVVCNRVGPDVIAAFSATAVLTITSFGGIVRNFYTLLQTHLP